MFFLLVASGLQDNQENVKTITMMWKNAGGQSFFFQLLAHTGVAHAAYFGVLEGKSYHPNVCLLLYEDTIKEGWG